MKYCTHCGKEIMDEAVICVNCGCPVAGAAAATRTNTDNLLTKLSERVKINGIIWVVIAVLQIIAGITGAWFVLIVGVLNIVSAIKDINYSKTLLEHPAGIINAYEPLTGPIITLVYNLVIGGVIGVVGSIYYFVAIRNFVMENKNAFAKIENQVVC